MESDQTNVIVVAPTGRDAQLISDLLVRAQIGSKSFPTVSDALCAGRTAVDTFVFADEALTAAATGEINDFRSEQPPWSDVPILVLTRRPATRDVNPPLSSLGQVSIIERPVGRRPLLTAVQAALRARKRQYEARDQFETLNRVSNELRVANSMKDELLGLVSHELRTPLTGIVGCASILRRRSHTLDESVRETLLRDIDDHAVRLQRIIENMLVLSRADSSGEANVEPVLLQRIIPPVLEGLRPLRGARELTLAAEPDLPPVNANAVFVEQIVTNLVRNSEKYAAVSEPVDVVLAGHSGSVAVSVSDRGREFEQAEVAMMFEPFYRGHEHELRISGVGLGLPVCKRLTEALGGTIEAQPRPGGGLEVTAYFPVASE